MTNLELLLGFIKQQPGPRVQAPFANKVHVDPGRTAKIFAADPRLSDSST